MNILVVNDDGITAQGIHCLVEALSAVPGAKLFVCAPDQQRTAAGHGITVHQDVFFKETIFPGAERAFACSGTPADCVKLGMRIYGRLGIEMDFVCSGINLGSNLGTDVLYSGTVSAALEGSICGLPSVAFSSCSHAPTHFEAFAKLVPSVFKVIMERNHREEILNVNVPNLPLSEIRGIRLTKLGERQYSEEFDFQEETKGRFRYTYTGEEVISEELPQDNDIRAYKENYISITPVHRDLMAYDTLKELKNYHFEF